MDEVLQSVLSRLGVNYTAAWLRREVGSAPFAGSMFGLGTILTKYKLDWKCLRFDDKSELRTVGSPCVIFFRGEFATITSGSDRGVTLLTAGGKTGSMAWEELFREWDGVAMVVAATAESGEPDFGAHRAAGRARGFKRAALAALILVAAVIGVVVNRAAMTAALWCAIAVNLAGAGVALMLLQKELHIPNRFADRLCGLVRESRCENVTSSEGATLLGLVKLSEVGMAFFGVNLAALVFAPQAAFYLAVAAACVLPFSFWSVWYQKFRARSWCVLCLITLALMWVQAAVYLIGGVYGWPVPSWFAAALLLCAYGITVLVLNAVMTALKERNDGRRWHANYRNLKVSDRVVEAFEKDAPQFPTAPETCTSLVFGNPDAHTRITIFSNPYCGPCGRMHARVKDIPGSNTSVSYVMTYFSDELSRINRLMIAAYFQLGPERAWELMTRWHDGGKTQGEKFFDGLGLDPDSDRVSREMAKHDAWKRDDRLVGTPTVIINGREVMQPYTVDDYMYMPTD